MRKPFFYALSVALLPLLVGMDGCMSKTLNNCVASPEALGCPELCLDVPDLEHCSELPDGVIIDGGACGQCTVNMPFCDEATLECVECTAEVGCECVEEADCPGDAPLCSDNLCRGCLNDGECTGERGGHYCEESTGRCSACAEDCAATGSTPACHAPTGTCVECTVDTEESDCPAADGQETGPACDPENLTCTGELRNSLGFCAPCISDSECESLPEMGVYRCVPMLFDGAPHGNYCLLDHESHQQATGDPDALCPDQQPSPKVEMSVFGVEASYCTLREGISTCEAVLQFSSGPCSDDDSACGAPGLDDAVCQSNACSFSCVNDRDCGSGVGSCDPSLRTCTP